MAPHISDADRTLRLITLWLWVPSFVLLLVYGILANQVVLPLGNIPMSLSVLSTLIHLYPPSPINPVRKILNGKGSLSLLSDLAIAVFLIGLLIPGWILCAGGWEGNKMLGAYATVPMMAAFAIHAYFVLRTLTFSNIFSFLFPKQTCPHCNCDLSTSSFSTKKQQKQRAMSQYSASGTSSEKSYHEVTDQEANVGLESGDYQVPRASTDDENERLIGDA